MITETLNWIKAENTEGLHMLSSVIRIGVLDNQQQYKRKLKSNRNVVHE